MPIRLLELRLSKGLWNAGHENDGRDGTSSA